jgi:hypothetical protein
VIDSAVAAVKWIVIHHHHYVAINLSKKEEDFYSIVGLSKTVLRGTSENTKGLISGI